METKRPQLDSRPALFVADATMACKANRLAGIECFYYSHIFIPMQKKRQN
jgi:hypothetical protein